MVTDAGITLQSPEASSTADKSVQIATPTQAEQELADEMVAIQQTRLIMGSVFEKRGNFFLWVVTGPLTSPSAECPNTITIDTRVTPVVLPDPVEDSPVQAPDTLFRVDSGL